MSLQKLYDLSKLLRQIKSQQKELYDSYWLYRFSFFVDNADPQKKWDCYLVKQCHRTIDEENELSRAKHQLIDMRHKIDTALKQLQELE
jgi:hypothetical protein